MTKKDITYQDKLNELRLDVSHPNSAGLTFILVEGETDIRLFRKFFNLNNCKVENIPGGNSKVEDAVATLLNIYELVIGIRDADFNHLSTEQYSKSNMFLTDFHDIEMSLIIEDEVFKAIVLEYTNSSFVDHESIRSNIITLIEEISLLKWLNEKENLELKFDGIGFQHLLSFTDNKLNFEQYINNLLSKSHNAKITDVSLIINRIRVLRTTNPNAFQLCNGHDFIKAFSRFLNEKAKGKNLNDEIVSSLFRTNYRYEFYTRTVLYKKTKQWADYNNCFIYL